MARSAALAEFLAEAQAALGRTNGPAAKVSAEVVARWSSLGVTGAAPQRLEVCDYITAALSQNHSRLAARFAALEGELRWTRRITADPADSTFWNGHANAIVLGPGGLEERSDVLVGATVMAPGTLYPDHSHPPAEVYLPLSSGAWWNSEMAWNDPGLDGFIYNPPGILHAMRAGDKPFLALWFLPT